MDLRWPWMLLLALPVLAALLVFPRWRTPRVPADPVLLAHADRIRRLPRFRALVRRERLLALWLIAAVVATAAGAVWTAARPQQTTVSAESRSNRDVVLCLDASTSMYDEDTQVLSSYEQLASDLRGERISLVIWSEAAVTVFPLTDDAAYVQDQLAQATDAMARQDPEFVLGTFLGKRASAIGDGLVSCVDAFDHTDHHRGRAVVLASDNQPQGKPPIYDLSQAAAYAKKHHVRVYGIGSPDLRYRPGARAEFARAATSTGGSFQLMGEGDSTDRIAASIDQLEAGRLDEPPRIVVTDHPAAAKTLLGVGAAMLLVGWLVAGLVRRAARGGRR